MIQTVFFDHDGGVDDLLSLLLLLTMPDITLTGVVVTPADCYPDYAAEASRKFIDLMGKPEVSVAISTVRGVHAFPEVWRAQPYIINALPQLLTIEEPQTPLSSQEGVDFTVDTLMQTPEPVTYLMTGPCTTLVAALRREPKAAKKIKEIVWMAGAVNVTGNVRTYTHNGSAEWNIYWDAPSSHWLLQQDIPLTLVPLDVTNHVPVGIPFLKQLARQAHYEVAQLASVCWATTINSIPGYDYLYHMWDVLATTVIGRRNLFGTQQITIDLAIHPPNEGETIATPGGHPITMVTDVALNDFYEYLLQQFQCDFDF
uniref:Nucleoside hydrolase n=1 Tax=Roseihalotalea indica TaxID=2867963 RepID=A0AA49GQP9_9BACT|nr:nucleoside hydrolase [Tunicatimonas sp. TK19036]